MYIFLKRSGGVVPSTSVVRIKVCKRFLLINAMRNENKMAIKIGVKIAIVMIRKIAPSDRPCI